MRPKKKLTSLESEKAGEILADLVADDHSLKAIAERHGVSKSTVDSFLRSLRTTHLSFYQEVREHTADELLPWIDTRMMQLLRFLGPEKMEAASAKDLAISFGILNQNRALLRGEPTQIVSMEDRKKMSDLLPLVLKEAQRRGHTVDAEFTVEGEARGRVLHAESVDTNERASDYSVNRRRKPPRKPAVPE